MPEDYNYEFIKGLISLCRLYNVFASGNLSYDPNKVVDHMDERARADIIAALEKLVVGNEGWKFIKANRSSNVAAGQTSLILTDVDLVTDADLEEEKYDFFELIGQGTKSTLEVLDGSLFLECQNPFIFRKELPNGKITHIISDTIHIEEGQIIGAMYRKPKLEVHHRYALTDGSKVGEED